MRLLLRRKKTVFAAVILLLSIGPLLRLFRKTRKAVLPLVSCVTPQFEPDPSWVPAKFKPLDCAALHASDPVRMHVVAGDHLAFSLDSNTTEATCYYIEAIMPDDFHVDSTNKSRRQLLGTFRNNDTTKCPADVFALQCYDHSGNHTIFQSTLRCFLRHPVPDRINPTFSEPMFEEQLNIIFLGLDSVSHVGWVEQLPNTTHYLETVLSATTFSSYNIVGDGTTAAILGLLTGYQEEELPESRRGYKGAKPVDDFPFLFKRLQKEKGYVTLWDEDGPSTGTFQYRLLGFKKPPVDYYGRKFQIALTFPSDYCLSELSTFEEMIRQVRHLFHIYPDPTPKFALIFNGGYSHDSRKAYLLDSQFLAEIKWLNANGHFNNSLVVFFSDHGPRFSKDRASDRGKAGERLPYLSLVFPRWFKEKYRGKFEILQQSSQRLATPFDLHATLLDVAGLQRLSGTPKRGVSFFTGISPRRTCADAGIAPHWCSCMTSKQALAVDDAIVGVAMKEFESHVNSKLLSQHTEKCANLKASDAFSVSLVELRQEVVHFVETIDGHGRVPKFDSKSKGARDGFLQVSFRTQPGNGTWEATFKLVGEKQVKILPNQISRTNKYGDAPKCVQDHYPHLRQFCFCLDPKAQT